MSYLSDMIKPSIRVTLTSQSELDPAGFEPTTFWSWSERAANSAIVARLIKLLVSISNSDWPFNVTHVGLHRQESWLVLDQNSVSTDDVDSWRSVEFAAVGKTWVHGSVHGVEQWLQHVGYYKGNYLRVWLCLSPCLSLTTYVFSDNFFYFFCKIKYNV